MAAKKKRIEKREGTKDPARTSRGRSAGVWTEYAIRQTRDQKVFELAPPRGGMRRAADLEEVHAMLEAGETDVAVDELRWLLEGCPRLLEAHKLLGEIAAADEDLPLARAHFGRAYELGLKAIPSTGLPGTLPYAQRANQVFFEAGKGLAWSLVQLGQADLAAAVIRQLLTLDPTDPLGLEKLLSGSEK